MINVQFMDDFIHQRRIFDWVFGTVYYVNDKTTINTK